MATDIEIQNHIIVPCCMKDRTFGLYVNEAREEGRPILARSNGDVTAKHYLEFFVDFTPGCKAVYVALPKLDHETVYQLCDMMRMDCKQNGKLVKRVPKLYVFTSSDEANGNASMAEFAESALSVFGERAKVIRMDVCQSIVAMEHTTHPLAVLGKIPVKPSTTGHLHIVTIIGDAQQTKWITRALRSVGKVKCEATTIIRLDD